jgi:gliding motility-associated-like protein
MYRIIFILTALFFNSLSYGQDLCSGATDLGTISCGDNPADMGTPGHNPDSEATDCMIGLAGTWFSFTTVDALQEITLFGPDYELFEGSCGSLNFLDGCTDGLVVNVDPSEQYYLLVNGSFSIETSSVPSNDNCSNAIDATGGISGENNFCATDDLSICGSDGDASVWYSYNLDQDVASFEVIVNSTGITDPVLAIYESCGSIILEECGTTLTLECLSAGTYYIQVASAYGNNGTFDLTFTETLSSVSNETCDSAEDITPSNTCSAETVSGDTSGACPEANDYGSGCDIDINPTVWFSFTTTSNTTSIDLTELSSNLELALVDASCSSSSFPCVVGDINIPVSGNETYYIAASLTTGGGSFEFDITLNEPPSNDICDNAEPLEGGTFNTCCGAIEGIDDCGGSETGVWYEIFGPDGDGSLITFSNIDMSGSIGIEIYEGDCGGLTLINEPYCDGAGSYSFETANCGATNFYVHITSSNSGCGSFDLTIDPLFGCSFGEDCGDGPTLTPTTGAGEDCAAGCNVYACDSDCSEAGVWFIVETDELATEMSVVVSDVGGSNVDPVVTILQADCSGGALVTCADVASGDIIETAVSGNQLYYIEVSTGSGGDPGDFEICVSTDESQVECSDGSIDVTRPEYPDADPEGPYCPGEIVNFCYDVTFTVDPIGQGNNCQWIQGIIPTLGGGWDLEAMSIDAQGPGGSWFWLEEGEVEYNAPSSILGTINTPHGLGLEYGPGTLSEGDPLPGAWWSVSDGGGCANNGNPNTMWGLPASCGSSQDVSFCFDLQVTELDDISQCSDPDFTDLKVHIFTMADGQTGCWSNNSCSGDTPVTFNAQIDCTSLVFVVAEDEEVCSNDVLSILVETEDGSDADIIVELIEEGNTSGASNWEFPGGMGVIADQIENEGEDVEIVIYEAYASDPNSICEGPRTEIEVIVYPDIEIEGEDPYYICYQMPQEIEPLVTGGDGGPYEYEWENGETSSSVILPEDPDLLPGLYAILLTVIDETGCRKEEIIEYEIVEPLFPEIINPIAGVCRDGVEDLPELIVEFESVGTGPYEYLWQANPGGLEFENGDNDPTLIINEEESSARSYTIFCTIIDDYGCEYTAETELTVDNGPELVLEIEECFGSAFQLSGFEDDNQPINLDLYYDAEGDWIFDGSTILNAELLLSQFGTELSYLAEDYGSYILQGTSANGCLAVEALELPPVPLPDFVVFPNDTVCVGTEITVSVNNSEDYVDFNWSNNENTSSFTDTPTDTITYYLVVETEDDCEITDSLTIIVNPLPPLNITGSQSICPGSQTILTVQGGPEFSYLWNGPNGEMITTQSATIATPGTWDVTLVSDSGCINTRSIEIEENAQLNPQISGADICTGNSTLLDGGPGFDAYEWLDASSVIIGTQQTLVVSEGGQYILNVVLGSGPSACTGSDTFNVAQFDPLPDALSANTLELCNVDNGLLPTSVDLTTYELGIPGTWFNQNNLPVADPTNIDFDGSAAGTYNYSFRTNAAMAPCPERSFSFAVNVIDCSCPSAAISTPPDFCASTDTFELNRITQTAEPGVWTIDNNAIELIDNLLIINESVPSGQYTLTYNLIGQGIPPECDIDSSVTFSVFEALDAEFVQNFEICNEDTGNGPDTLDLDDLLISGSPGVWSSADPSLSVDANNLVRFTGVPTGQYRFFYLMEDPLSPCPAVTRSVTVNVIDCSCPPLEILPLPDLCNTGGNIQLSNYILNPTGRAGTWSVDGPDDTALAGTSIIANNRTPGQYEISFTFNNPVGGSCISTVSSSFKIYEPPKFSLEPEAFACNGTNITVYPTVLNLNDFVSGSTGSWTAPQEYNNGIINDPEQLDFEGLNPGIYNFEFTTDSAVAPCEEITRSIAITVRNCNCPSVNFVPPTPLCNDGPDVDLNNYLPDDAPEGSWSFVNGSPIIDLANSDVFALADLEGFYLFQYTLDEVPEGCPDFGQISIEIVAPPVVSHIPEAEVCNDTSVNAPLCVDLNDFISGVDGTWTVDPMYDGDASDISNICFDNEDVGEILFFIFNTETGSVTCDERQYTTRFELIDCSCPNLSLNDPEDLCSSLGEYDLSQLETDVTSEGNWAFVSGPLDLSLSEDITDISDAQTGTYVFRFTPDEAGSSDCTEFVEIAIDIYEQTSAGVPMNSGDCIEPGGTIILEDYLDGEDPGGTWRSQYDIGTGILADPDGSTVIDLSQYPSGLLQIEYFSPFSMPCVPQISEFEIIILPEIEVEQEDSPCADSDAGAIIITSIDNAEGLLYSIDGGQSWTDQSEFNDLAPGIYNLNIEDQYGCRWELETVELTEPQALAAFAGEDRQVEENIGAISLEVSGNFDINTIEDVVWMENGTVICSGTPELCWEIEVNPDGVAEYCVTVTDFNGCISTDCVVLRERVVRDVYIPNVFMPGTGSGEDVFYIQTDQYIELINEFRIYDRWGNLVFEAEPDHEPNSRDSGWDGTRNDEYVQQGVYVYVIRLTYTDGQQEFFTGDITLIRN